MNDPPTLELVRRVLLERKHNGVRKHERALRAASRQLWRAYQRACNGASALLSPLTHVYLRTREDARLERVRRGEYSVFFVGE